MPKAQRKDANIVRATMVNQRKRPSRGVQVRIRRDGEDVSKWFDARTYGTISQARIAARAWRDQTMRDRGWA